MLVEIVDQLTGRLLERREESRCNCRGAGGVAFVAGRKRRVVEAETVHGRSEDLLILWVTTASVKRKLGPGAR